MFTMLLILATSQDTGLFRDVESIEQQLRETGNAIEDTRGLVELTRIDLSRLRSQEAVAKIRYREVLKDYKRRIRALARLPRGARLVVLGKASSLRDYLRTSQVLRRIARVDHDLAKRHGESAQELRGLKDEVQQRVSELRNHEQALRTRRQKLLDLRRQRMALVDRVLRDSKSSRDAIAEAQRARRALAEFIDTLDRRASVRAEFTSNRGRLTPPSRAPISAGFGVKREQHFGTATPHPGIEFQASAGSPVFAVAPGHVVLADWKPAFGQLVVIDHGDDYHSLYAHLSEMRVQAGDAVNVGDTIGEVGDTGSLRGPILYFELRYQGRPINPERWFRVGHL
ncbi:MAG: peptidoglycan DD-metalloendopeptidase family protein [Myxococcota bacterium]